MTYVSRMDAYLRIECASPNSPVGYPNSDHHAEWDTKGAAEGHSQCPRYNVRVGLPATGVSRTITPA